MLPMAGSNGYRHEGAHPARRMGLGSALMARIGDGGDLLKCSFCGKSQKQVKKLIAGPGVYICDECIDLCNEIIEEELAEAGEVRQIFVGEDFQFGHDRGGNVRTLAADGPKYGFDLVVAKPVKHGGEVVSSTRIRNAILAGDAEGATRLLGRPYSVRGTVVHGAKRGRALGFPTINLAVPPERLLPRDGIYAVRVRVGDQQVAAAASLGVRPTFGGGDRTLEAYLLDWEGDVYGERIEAAFVKRIRDELRFANAAELSAQIALDVEETRRALG